MAIRHPTGWTPVPHAILEAVARAPLPRSHHSVVAVIVRETIGYHRPEATLRIAQIAAACEIHDRSVRRAITDLEHWRVIARRRAGQGRAASFRIRPPGDWRIGATVASLERRASRLRAGLASQLELSLSGVAELSVLPLPSVTSRNTPRAAAPEVEPAAHPSLKEKEKCVPSGWSDVTGTHRALSRRLEELGVEPPADLWHRVGKALALARSRGRVSGDPLAYAELWVLEDLRKLGRGPIRHREAEPVATRTSDPAQQQLPGRTAEDRRVAAARMLLRWRTGAFPTAAEISEKAATLTHAEIDAAFEELDDRLAKVDSRNRDRAAQNVATHEFQNTGRRKR